MANAPQVTKEGRGAKQVANAPQATVEWRGAEQVANAPQATAERRGAELIGHMFPWATLEGTERTLNFRQ